MGFDEAQATRALEESNFVYEDALNRLAASGAISEVSTVHITPQFAAQILACLESDPSLIDQLRRSGAVSLSVIHGSRRLSMLLTTAQVDACLQMARGTTISQFLANLPGNANQSRTENVLSAMWQRLYDTLTPEQKEIVIQLQRVGLSFPQAMQCYELGGKTSPGVVEVLKRISSY
jgi:hypothetical protein